MRTRVCLEYFAASNLINYMRQKFDLNAAFTLYTNFVPDDKFEMPLYNPFFLPHLIFSNTFLFKCSILKVY